VLLIKPDFLRINNLVLKRSHPLSRFEAGPHDWLSGLCSSHLFNKRLYELIRFELEWRDLNRLLLELAVVDVLQIHAVGEVMNELFEVLSFRVQSFQLS
jgi:hypothetical protein